MHRVLHPEQQPELFVLVRVFGTEVRECAVECELTLLLGEVRRGVVSDELLGHVPRPPFLPLMCLPVEAVQFGAKFLAGHGAGWSFGFATNESHSGVSRMSLISTKC